MNPKIKSYSFLTLIYSFILLYSTTYSQIYINQLGYLPEADKYFVSDVESDSFFIHDNVSGEIKFRGKMELWAIDDPSTRLTLYGAKFSDFNEQGSFYVADNTGLASYPFIISNTVYKDAYYKTLRGFYYWRCGSALLGGHAGLYFHQACHTADGFFHSSSGSTGFKPAAGGWHDAGDYGKYVVNAGISVGTMLLAYEIFPQRFSQDDFNIPESGNNIPDILDENRYEIEWMLKMQNIDGGVFHKLTKKNFEGTVMPNSDSGQRLIYEISSTATGDFAAVCAIASRVFRNYDPAFADTCLNAALRAWAYLEANTSIVPAGGFKNPSDTFTGQYGDGNDSDERLWAAVELFGATTQEKYHTYIKAHYKDSDLFRGSMSWASVRSLAHLSYLMSTNSAFDAAVQAELLNALKTYCGQLVNTSNTDGFCLTLRSTEFNWGSNSDVANKAILLISAYAKTDNIDYYNTALAQLNYIYGLNAHNLSFVSGTGTNSMMRPHHRPSQADGIAAPVPGYVAGGPNNHGTGGDALLDNIISKGTPPALCYIDADGSWASNEVCLNWNSPLVFVTGYFNGEGTASAVDDEKIKSNIPEGINLQQNFPNPFNGTTSISFSLKERQNIRFKIYDIVGNLITDKNLGELPAGNNSFNWNARQSNSGSEIASGIYFYFLEGKEKSEIKKLILLK